MNNSTKNKDVFQKNIEEELEKREESYRDLVENSPDAVIVARGDSVLFINETGARLFGASRKEDIQRMKIVEMIHPDYHEFIKEREEIIDRGDATDFLVYKLIRLDGTVFEAEV